MGEATHISTKARCSNAQNRNRDGANDSVAVGPQVNAIRVAVSNEQIRIRLLRCLAQNLWYSTTADEYFGLDAGVVLKSCDTLGSVADERFFPLLIYEPAAGSPKLHPGSDMCEIKTGPEFGGELGGPRHGFITSRAQIDRTQDVADRKLAPWRFFHVGTGPNRALDPA